MLHVIHSGGFSELCRKGPRSCDCNLLFYLLDTFNTTQNALGCEHNMGL